VVLATAVAESSLTVPGVRVVVDSGLAREPRTDHARGLGALTTVRVSRASAEQRAGRAGREAPGVVYRCWPEAEHGRLPRFPSPEIAVADLTAFALRAACWGDPDARGLALPDPPPDGAMAAAREVLRAIGAVDGSGRVTGRGEAMARLGLHPRLARALLDGAPLVGARRAAEVVALLSEEPPREYGGEVAAAWRAARRGGDAYAARWRREARRLADALPADGSGAPPTLADSAAPAAPADLPDDAAAGLVVALAFPERVARSRGGRTYLMASGTRAELAPGSGLRDAPWLAVAVADRPVGAASARVRLAAAVDEDTARRAAGALYARAEEVLWSAGRRDVVARRVERLGAVELASAPLEEPDPALVRAALLEGLRREGPELLHWTPQARSLRQRLAFLHRELGEPWPDVSDGALLARAEEWLGPVLDAARVLTLQRWTREVPVADSVFRYAASLVRATRPGDPAAPDEVRRWVRWGAGPRAGQALILGARASALLAGRFHATPDDVRRVAAPVLRHRVLVNFHAEAEGVTPDAVVARLLEHVRAPSSGV